MSGPLILVGQKRVRDLEVGDVVDYWELSSWSPQPHRPEWREIVKIVPAEHPVNARFLYFENEEHGYPKLGHEIVTAQIEVEA